MKARLGEVYVREIRRLDCKCFSTRDLADRYGVSTANIRAILKGRTWRHLE
jgi:hypothetical protein